MLHPGTSLWLDNGLRIGISVLVGAIVGINRDLHHKSIGLRTLGLVSLASCLLVLTISQFAIQQHSNASDATSRVVQGIVSGIGFLGAGVILRGPDQLHVLGLTTAAAILVVAALGVTCGLAAWPVLFLGVGATLFLLVVCRPLERAIQRTMNHHQENGGDTFPPKVN